MAEKSEKMTKQELKRLKQPDAFQRVGAEARDWLDKRQKVVAIAVVRGAARLLARAGGAALLRSAARRRPRASWARSSRSSPAR